MQIVGGIQSYIQDNCVLTYNGEVRLDDTLSSLLGYTTLDIQNLSLVVHEAISRQQQTGPTHDDESPVNLFQVGSQTHEDYVSKITKSSSSVKGEKARHRSTTGTSEKSFRAEPTEQRAVKRRKTGIGSQKFMLSDSLAQVIGRKYATRTKAVQEVWKYIRLNNLQSPEDRRNINCDRKLKLVTGVDVCTIFTLNRYLSSHFHPIPSEILIDDETSDESDGSVKSASKQDDILANGNKKHRTYKQVTGVFTKKYKLSPELANVVGKEYSTRPRAIRCIWKHIKEKKLQKPEDKRKIVCDNVMKELCNGASEITMFNMQTYLKSHFGPVPEGVEVPVESDEEVWRCVGRQENDWSSDSPSTSSEHDVKSSNSKSPGKIVRSGFTLHKFKLSDELAEIVGKPYSTRVRALRRLWQYVRLHHLQDDSDKRRILCDEKLKKLFGGQSSVTMFEVNSLISPHFSAIPEHVQVSHDSEDDEHKIHVHKLQEAERLKQHNQDEENRRLKEIKKLQKSYTKRLQRIARKMGEKGEEVRRTKVRLQRGNSSLITKKYALSPELSQVVGKQYATRGRVVKGIWQYVREKGLQKPEDKRYAHCDEVLERLCWGEKEISIYNINKFISGHFSEIPGYVCVQPDSEDEVSNQRKADLQSKLHELNEELRQLKVEEARVSEQASRVVEMGDKQSDKKLEMNSDRQRKKSALRKSGFHVLKLELSEPLSEVVGKKYASRSKVVKRIWQYAQNKGLTYGRVIYCDAKLRQISNDIEEVTMFTLEEMIESHLKSPGTTPPRDSEDEESEENDDDEGMNADDGVPGTSLKSGGPVYRLSSELSELLKGKTMTRPQVIKHLWEYFRLNNLENPENRREIVCDQALQRVFGQSSMNMFTLQRYITPHLKKISSDSLVGGSDE